MSKTQLKVLFALVIVAIVVVAYAILAIAKPHAAAQNTTTITTTIFYNMTAAIAKASSAALSLSNIKDAKLYNETGGIYRPTSPSCTAKSFVNRLFQIPATEVAANYSAMNKTIPFAIYENIYVYNITLTNISLLSSTCRNITQYIKYAGVYSVINVTGLGSMAQATLFDNLTEAGLNATDVPYIGPMPHLSWYSIDFVYKNYFVVVGIWGFYGHMNMTTLINYANYTYQLLR
ncbi:MAG: hypothetical protein QW393_00645 [Candidatus Micrarchaeaceae archaeon]